MIWLIINQYSYVWCLGANPTKSHCPKQCQPYSGTLCDVTVPQWVKEDLIRVHLILQRCTSPLINSIHLGYLKIKNMKRLQFVWHLKQISQLRQKLTWPPLVLYDLYKYLNAHIQIRLCLLLAGQSGVNSWNFSRGSRRHLALLKFQWPFSRVWLVLTRKTEMHGESVFDKA